MSTVCAMWVFSARNIAFWLRTEIKYFVVFPKLSFSCCITLKREYESKPALYRHQKYVYPMKVFVCALCSHFCCFMLWLSMFSCSSPFALCSCLICFTIEMEFDVMFFLQIEVKVDFYFITLYLYTFDRMGE